MARFMGGGAVFCPSFCRASLLEVFVGVAGTTAFFPFFAGTRGIFERGTKHCMVDQLLCLNRSEA
jgi:hypothetical protein